MKKSVLLFCIIISIVLTTACSGKSNLPEIDNSLISSYNLFDVTSSNLKNGKWDKVIAQGNENHSPELSWEPVEGATSYMIYMVDTTGRDFIHWKSCDITETSLPEGWASESDYVGPYPPPGESHIYEIYVIAVKNPVESMKGAVNGQCLKFPEFVQALDTDVDGNTGNIVGAAHIIGSYKE